MRLVEIIPEQQIVIVDGTTLKLSFDLDENYKTIYWDEQVKSGFIEFREGGGEAITSMDAFTSILDDFQDKLSATKSTAFALRIIPEDGMVIVDDKARHLENFGDFAIDKNYHAVHWDGEGGFVETKSGLNLALKNVDEFQDLIDAHAALLAQEEADKLEAVAEYNKEENALRREIVALEDQITSRRMREAVLSGDTSFIQNIEDQIAVKRARIQEIEGEET